ncbi:MAG TPA: choice-of-anchor D domain-containing protein, partial [Thermodesulfobacteriota bacterium]|nr:choice-of-anchor D domain-containing protein [Thermodesulfobacteriota bacterium]
LAAGDDGVLLSSIDGSAWTPRDSGNRARLLAASGGQGWFVVAAEDGAILKAPANPQISVSPSSLDFGSVNVGSSFSKVLTVSNSGGAGLLISRMEIGGTYVTDFITQNDQCTGQTLSASSDCTVQVVFSPHATGSKSALLTVYSNDPVNSTRTVPLTGVSNAYNVDSHGSYCFISWMAEGSWLEELLDLFREFRDAFLSKSAAGQTLAGMYYGISPRLTEITAPYEAMRKVVRWGLVLPAGLSLFALKTSTAGKALLLFGTAAVLAGFKLQKRRKHPRRGSTRPA